MRGRHHMRHTAPPVRPQPCDLRSPPTLNERHLPLGCRAVNDGERGIIDCGCCSRLVSNEALSEHGSRLVEPTDHPHVLDTVGGNTPADKERPVNLSHLGLMVRDVVLRGCPRVYSFGGFFEVEGYEFHSARGGITNLGSPIGAVHNIVVRNRVV